MADNFVNCNSQQMLALLYFMVIYEKKRLENGSEAKVIVLKESVLFSPVVDV